jgi:hypothetical protein
MSSKLAASEKGGAAHALGGATAPEFCLEEGTLLSSPARLLCLLERMGVPGRGECPMKDDAGVAQRCAQL